MRGKIFFLFTMAAVIAVALALGGAFGPLSFPQASDQTQSASAQDKKPSLPMIGVTAPAIRWVEPAKANDNGRIRLAFRVEASSPLTSLQLQITAVTPPEGGLKVEKEMREIPTWIMGNKSLDWDGEIDLTGSLLAGQPVLVQIIAVDEDKRSGTSETAAITLPEHRFTQPLAQALYTLRKGLQQEPDGRRNEALRALAGLLQQRATFENQDLTLLTLRSAAVRIALDNSHEGLQSALNLLWHAALLLEQNPASNVTLSLRMSPKPVTKPE